MLIPIFISIIALVFTHAVQMDKYTKDFQKANIEFNGTKYLKGERYGIVASICVIIISAFAWKELIGFKPSLEAFPIISFVIIGGIGTWILSYVFGSTRKFLWKEIDKKTNIADGIEDKP